jgi:cell division septal protein FtsQ
MSEKRFNKSRGRRLAAGIFKGFLVCLVGAFIFTAAACGLQEVTINGNYHESEEEVLRLLGRGPFAHNTVFLYLFNRGRKVSGNTFVDTLTVDLDTRNSITVNVNEKKLIGYVEYDDRYWYFNRAGVILVSTEKNTDPSAGNDIAESVGEDPAAADPVQKTDFRGGYGFRHSAGCLLRRDQDHPAAFEPSGQFG